MISIVFPHAINSGNDAVLNLKLKMLQDNTRCQYEILYLANMKRPDLVYKGWDWLIRNAKFDLILWDNSDIVYAPEWDVNVLRNKDNANWIGLELVECGQIGVHTNNIHMDFGITAETFRRAEFESWVAAYSANRHNHRPGFSWYSPSVWKKDWYISMGGFDLSHQFPHPVDSMFREKAEKLGQRFIVANSFAYHFQRAGENLGEKPERV